MRRALVWIPLCITILAASTKAFATEDEHKPRRDATKQKDLSERLIRESATASEEDVMDRLMRLMGESARRLEIEFDAGEETQAVQQQISKELDDAIKMAASRIHKRSPRDSSAAGEKRRRRADDEAKRTRSREPGGQRSGSASSESSTDSASVPVRGSDSDAPFRESRRSWGNLPQRQREEVLQGVGEQFLERYRDWIERYYRALQESEE